MSSVPPNAPLNPSQTVERIREILVGRQLDRLEQRIDRLERGGGGGEGEVAGFAGEMDGRLLSVEARLEAMGEQMRRHADDAVDGGNRLAVEQLREETRRLSEQIQRVAAVRASSQSEVGREISGLEQRVGSWLGEWQRAVHDQSVSREHALAESIRSEVSQLWEATEEHITRVERRCVDAGAIEDRFRRIARAATLLAESCAPDRPENRSAS